jgi:formate dehydrogenase (NADP+) alpha subunit
MIRLTINGREIQAEEGRTILDVSREQGIYIPSLCDHERLKPFTGCRLCLVEIKGRRGYAPACGTYIEEGQIVTTETPDIQKIRRTIIELILAEHPHACLICSERTMCVDYKSTIRKVGEVTGCILCPNNGRCELQDAVVYLKVDKVRFPALFRNYDIRKDDPFIDRDYNLCILCGRCVRICHEVRGASVLTFIRRGPQTEISTALNGRLLDSQCLFCGACVDVCPTGSLAERGARYLPPPEEKKSALCGFCSQGCELTLEIGKGRIQAALPAAKGVVNQGQACVRGRFLIKEAVYHPRRILKPMVRKKGALVETTWDEALDVTIRKWTGITPDAVALYGTSQNTCEDVFAFRRFGREGLKTAYVAGPEMFSAAAGYRRFARANRIETVMNFRMSDLSRTKTFVLFGEELPDAQPILWLEVHKAIHRGARLITVGPEELCVNRYASGWVKIDPEKEYLLTASLTKILLESSDHAEASAVEGFAELRKRIQAFKISDALLALGVSEDKLGRLALLLEKKKPAAFLFGPKSCSGRWGRANLEAMWNLALFTQGRLVPLDSDGNARGALEVSSADGHGLKTAKDVLDAIHSGKIKALYLCEPIPGLAKDKVEFTVYQGSFMNEAAESADVVLPETTFVESGGTFVNIEGRIQKLSAAIPPLGEARPGWTIVRELARKMGLTGFDYQDVSEIFADMAKSLPAFHGLNAGQINPETMVRDLPKNGKRFLVSEAAPPADEPSTDEPVRDPDTYRGLAMAVEVKSLNRIRNRGE